MTTVSHFSGWVEEYSTRSKIEGGGTPHQLFHSGGTCKRRRFAPGWRRTFANACNLLDSHRGTPRSDGCRWNGCKQCVPAPAFLHPGGDVTSPMHAARWVCTERHCAAMDAEGTLCKQSVPAQAPQGRPAHWARHGDDLQVLVDVHVRLHLVPLLLGDLERAHHALDHLGRHGGLHGDHGLDLAAPHGRHLGGRG
jgi:hypothetical protein